MLNFIPTAKLGGCRSFVSFGVCAAQNRQSVLFRHISWAGRERRRIGRSAAGLWPCAARVMQSVTAVELEFRVGHWRKVVGVGLHPRMEPSRNRAVRGRPARRSWSRLRGTFRVGGSSGMSYRPAGGWSRCIPWTAVV